MRKLRIGVLVNEFKPEVGGAHNFVQAVASQLPFGDTDLELIEFVLILEENIKIPKERKTKLRKTTKKVANKCRKIQIKPNAQVANQVTMVWML